MGQQLATATSNSLQVSFPNYNKTLTVEENRVLALHEEGKPLKHMEAAEFSINAKALLLKISVATGWKMLEGNALNVLIDQFSKKLKEDYLSLTCAEIEYAFRNVSEIKSWGASFNLQLIDKVLIPFINNRASIRETRDKTFKELPPEKIDQKLSDQQSYDYWKGEILNNCPVSHIPSSLFDSILRLKNVTPKEKSIENCIYKAQKHILHEHSARLTSTDPKKRLGDFKELSENISKLKGEVEEWQKLPIVQRYAKAFWCKSYFLYTYGLQ